MGRSAVSGLEFGCGGGRPAPPREQSAPCVYKYIYRRRFPDRQFAAYRIRDMWVGKYASVYVDPRRATRGEGGKRHIRHPETAASYMRRNDVVAQLLLGFTRYLA